MSTNSGRTERSHETGLGWPRRPRIGRLLGWPFVSRETARPNVPPKPVDSRGGRPIPADADRAAIESPTSPDQSEASHHAIEGDAGAGPGPAETTPPQTA